MYRIREADNGSIIEDALNLTFIKQQRLVDLPILAEGLEEADGVVLSDGNTMLGIKGRNMDNYTPLVTVEEISGEPYIMRELEAMKSQLNEVHTYQTSETVLKNDLDTAYRNGVNEYQ